MQISAGKTIQTVKDIRMKSGTSRATAGPGKTVIFSPLDGPTWDVAIDPYRGISSGYVVCTTVPKIALVATGTIATVRSRLLKLTGIGPCTDY